MKTLLWIAVGTLIFGIFEPYIFGFVSGLVEGYREWKERRSRDKHA